MHGEISVLTQWVYARAAPHAQKTIRGALTRLRVRIQRKQFYAAAELAAAVQIQRVVRGHRGRRIVQGARYARAAGTILKLQVDTCRLAHAVYIMCDVYH